MGRPALDKRITPRVEVEPGDRALYGDSAYPLQDLSLGGAFIKDTEPLPAGSTIYLTLYLTGERVSLEGLVRRSLPGRGMGIQFRNVPAEARNRLEKYLNRLAQTGKRLKKGSPTPSATVRNTSRSESAAPAKQAAVLSPATAPSGEEDGMSGRLRRLSVTLRELEEDIVSGEVDARVLSEFRESVDHIRHTARAVQQWIEHEKQDRDPYSVLPLLVADRIQRATRLNQEISLDVDAQEVSQETAGIENLYDALKKPCRRLARLWKTQPT